MASDIEDAEFIIANYEKSSFMKVCVKLLDGFVKGVCLHTWPKSS